MRHFCGEFRKAVEAKEIVCRRADINRDVQKRLLRMVAVTAMESLPDKTCERICAMLFRYREGICCESDSEHFYRVQKQP